MPQLVFSNDGNMILEKWRLNSYIYLLNASIGKINRENIDFPIVKCECEICYSHPFITCNTVAIDKIGLKLNGKLIKDDHNEPWDIRSIFARNYGHLAVRKNAHSVAVISLQTLNIIYTLHADFPIYHIDLSNRYPYIAFASNTFSFGICNYVTQEILRTFDFDEPIIPDRLYARKSHTSCRLLKFIGPFLYVIFRKVKDNVYIFQRYLYGPDFSEIFHEVYQSDLDETFAVWDGYSKYKIYKHSNAPILEEIALINFHKFICTNPFRSDLFHPKIIKTIGKMIGSSMVTCRKLN